MQIRLDRIPSVKTDGPSVFIALENDDGTLFPCPGHHWRDEGDQGVVLRISGSPSGYAWAVDVEAQINASIVEFRANANVLRAKQRAANMLGRKAEAEDFGHSLSDLEEQQRCGLKHLRALLAVLKDREAANG